MKFGRAPKALKSARKEAELTQQQLSMDDELFLSLYLIRNAAATKYSRRWPSILLRNIMIPACP